MTKSEWTKLFRKAMQELRKQAFVPYDTGNLKFNAIKGVWINETTFRIYIDEKVAPYMKFTNETWQYGKNPNEKWWENMVERFTEDLAEELDGVLKKL